MSARQFENNFITLRYAFLSRKLLIDARRHFDYLVAARVFAGFQYVDASPELAGRLRLPQRSL